MSDNPPADVPLHFWASFPCDPRFGPAMTDLSAKVARQLGYPDAEARDIAQAVERAYDAAAAAGKGGGDVQVSVTIQPQGEAIEAEVRCPQRVLLQLTRPGTK
jgi:hypothetical protein